MSDIHVHPIGDADNHTLEGTQCKCEPKVIVEPNCDMVIVHNSFDGREAVEWAKNTLSLFPPSQRPAKV